jgi:DNA-binding NarL/FixJ family response regulator
MEPLVTLIVDAGPIFLQSLTQFLAEQAPDQIVVGGAVSDGAVALSLAASIRPNVVLVGLASFAQPVLQLLPQLRAILPQASIIVLGVLEANGYRQAALAAGADAFLPKDDLPVTLMPAIMDVMRGRRDD